MEATMTVVGAVVVVGARERASEVKGERPLPVYYADGLACPVCGEDGHATQECPWRRGGAVTTRGGEALDITTLAA